jgi:hypothetical protein
MPSSYDPHGNESERSVWFASIPLIFMNCQCITPNGDDLTTFVAGLQPVEKG